MKNRKRNRMNGFDYASNRLYFVTNCVKNNVCCLGRVVPLVTGRDLSVQHPFDHNPLNHSLNHPVDIYSPENEYIVELNPYGLIVKERIHWLMSQYAYVDIHNYVVMPNHFHFILEIDSSKVDEHIKIKPLSELLGAMQTTSSRQIHQLGLRDFAWHRSYHDHIIRNEKSYRSIFNYINDNPKNWAKDRFYPKNVSSKV